MLAGVLLVMMGITGLGGMVKYFPRPVVVGFTNGIAILIASTQIRDLFGLQMEHVPGDFFHRMGAIAANFHTLNWGGHDGWICFAGGDDCVREISEEGAGSDFSLLRGDGCSGDFSSAGRDDWNTIWRNPERLAAPGDSPSAAATAAAFAFAGGDGGDAGGD